MGNSITAQGISKKFRVQREHHAAATLGGAIWNFVRKLPKKLSGKFSEVEDFIDIPLKKYSTGMRLRLAFAVAAHLNADILLIDEVLAVGDLAFQKKCLDKMNEIISQGRTILYVSHNLDSIRNLCQR